jgi:hypothetical protein
VAPVAAEALSQIDLRHAMIAPVHPDSTVTSVLFFTGG